MKKQLALMAAAALAAFASDAAPLTPEQAIARARGNAPARIAAQDASQMKLTHTATTASGRAAAYVFTREGAEGFSILSADDMARPVLGYSDDGIFDSDNMPPALKYWLGQYAAQIQYAESKGITPAKAPRDLPQLAPISPLIKTRWNQDEPYNLLTPKINNTPTPTGCVATSMAQCMYYFKYPEIGTGYIDYKDNGKSYFMNFAKQPFDWDNMLLYYAKGDYNDTQANAVAYLMKACGYAVEMMYNTSASGAQSVKVAPALRTYFGYDPGITYLDRNNYSLDQWTQLCYDNLKNCGPIIYNGTDPIAGGHSFVIDGYDGNGYFHLNWGWGGMSDGYFTLDALTPTAQGWGGAQGGFNYSQNAVIGMRKPTGKPAEVKQLALTQIGELTASIAGNNLTFKTTGASVLGWGNMNPQSMTFTVAAIFEPVGGGDKKTVEARLGNSSMTSVTLDTYYTIANASAPIVTLPQLADGKYTATVATRLTNGEFEDYIPCISEHGYANYVILTVKDGKYSVEAVEPKLLKFESLEVVSPLYYDRNTRLKAKVSNPYDIQISACVTPQLFSNRKVQFTAETIYITLDPGETKDVEWTCRFFRTQDSDNYSDPSTYTLRLLNQNTKTLYGSFGDVEMTSISNGFSLKMQDFAIDNAERKDLSMGGKDYKNVFIVPNPEDFTLSFKYDCTRGYFDTQFVIGIYTRNAAGLYIPATDYIFESTPFLGQDESESETIKVNFPHNNPDNVYYIRAEYMRGGQPTYLSQIMFHSDVNDVESILDEESLGTVEYFNLQGVRIAEPEKGRLLIRRQGGKAEKVIF